MSNAQHTPGPWHFEDLGEDQGKWVSATPGGFGFHEDGSYLSVCASSIGDANARLIAAAPDLLAALMDAREHIAMSAPDWHIRTQEMLATVDAAIAKARGQQ